MEEHIGSTMQHGRSTACTTGAALVRAQAEPMQGACTAHECMQYVNLHRHIQSYTANLT